MVLGFLILPDELRTDDEIHILAPRDFDLRRPGTTGECNRFQWTAGYNLFPNSITPLCDCRAAWRIDNIERCGMAFVMTSTQQPVLAMNVEIQFKVDTINPPQVVSEIGNFWVARHLRVTGTEVVNGVQSKTYETRSSQATPSWDVMPQLRNVVITIHGARRAAETYTDIRFS